MTIPAGDTTIDNHSGNSVADTFDYNFKITDKADLKVTKTEDATGVDTLLVVDTDYTVAGVGSDSGTITLVAGALAGGFTLTIEDNVILSQLSQFGNQSAFFGQSHENAIDKLTRLCKRLFSQTTLHLALPSSAFGANLTLPAGTVRAGKYMAFDANGDFTVAQSLGVWRGDWVTGTDYVAQDFMRDPANGNLYLSPVAYTAGATVAADVGSGSLVLILDMVSATDQAGYAEEWANKAEDSLISIAAGGNGTTDYSSFHWAAKTAADAIQTAADRGVTTQDAIDTAADAAATAADVLTVDGYVTTAAGHASTATTKAGEAAASADAAAASESAAEGVPIGTIIMWGDSTPPARFLECNDAAIGRTTYADLFAVVGTTFGVGDGSTTFNVPEFRAEFPRGWDSGRGADSGRVLGSWQIDEFKAHSHSAKQGFSANVQGSGGNSVFSSNSVTGTTGGTETRPRNVAVMFCIKY